MQCYFFIWNHNDVALITFHFWRCVFVTLYPPSSILTPLFVYKPAPPLDTTCLLTIHINWVSRSEPSTILTHTTYPQGQDARIHINFPSDHTRQRTVRVLEHITRVSENAFSRAFLLASHSRCVITLGTPWQTPVNEITHAGPSLQIRRKYGLK